MRDNFQDFIEQANTASVNFNKLAYNHKVINGLINSFIAQWERGVMPTLDAMISEIRNKINENIAILKLLNNLLRTESTIYILNKLPELMDKINKYSSLVALLQESYIKKSNFIKKNRSSWIIHNTMRELMGYMQGSELHLQNLEQVIIYLTQSQLRQVIEEFRLGEKISKKPYLKKLINEPFLLLFHRSNDQDYVNSILEMQESLPKEYYGRKIEYSFETDFFWIKHRNKEKTSIFLGHAPHGLIPGTAGGLWRMKNKNNLLLPKWLFSRAGKIKLVVEVKSGWGADTVALDQLIDLLKSYNLHNNVTFYCFSIWVMEYLKQRLPNSFTILICYSLSNSAIQYPFNRPMESLKKWGLFVKGENLNFIDAYANPAKKTEEKIIKQIDSNYNKGKFHFGGRVTRKEQLTALIQNGARGAMLWHEPKMVLEWFKE